MKRTRSLTFVVAVAVGYLVGFVLLFADWRIGTAVLAVAVVATLAAAYGCKPAPLAPAAPDWHVIDEELPAELSPTERGMQAANRTVTAIRWPEQWHNGHQRARRDAHQILGDVTGPECTGREER
jgi:hypothetical protein